MGLQLHTRHQITNSIVALLGLVLCGASMAAGLLPPPPGKQPMQPPALAQQSSSGAEQCFAYRTKGSDAWQIACYPNANGCASAKSNYQNNPAVEAMGCASAVYCFTYNVGGKPGAFCTWNQKVTFSKIESSTGEYAFDVCCPMHEDFNRLASVTSHLFT